MIAAIGKQLKQSVKVFHNLMLYRLLPETVKKHALHYFTSWAWITNVRHTSASNITHTPAYPKILTVSTPNSPWSYFQILDGIFCGWTTIQPKHESVKGHFFCHSSCKKSAWTHIFSHIFSYTDALQNWHTMTLGRLYLHRSAKVILDQRQNTFSYF